MLHGAASRWVTAAVTEDLADEYDHVLVTGLELRVLPFRGQAAGPRGGLSWTWLAVITACHQAASVIAW